MPSPRSLALNACLYASLVVIMIAALPTLVLPRQALMAYIRGWGRYFVWLCRVVGGIGLEVRGRENIPPGPLLVASKHQSIWETFALIGLFDDPCFILKRELTWIPLFGWYALKSHMLPVDRRGGSAVMNKLNQRAREEVRRDKGRQILFFPEGTRRPAGAPPAYRHGVSYVYDNLGVPCLPVALNSGLYWPRRSMKLRQGTVVVDILPPIPPGLPRDVFFARVQADIEGATDVLVREGRAALGLPVASSA
ncbi:lysophospholipid acyltransferase family protein [Alsobacter sp. R-9]